jgi:hypothetical protein
MATIKKLIKNYQKPTPPMWRKIGDMSLFLIPVVEAQLAMMPESINPWVKWGITTFLVLFKAWTNTRVESNIYEGNKD